MAGHLRTVEPWTAAPDQEIRKRKRVVEVELLKKITVKNDLVEFHPLILSSRREIANFYIGPSYSRVQAPAKQVLPETRNHWSVEDQALRQISKLERRGPRDCFLPNLVKRYAQIKLQDVPTSDWGYHARRAVANDRLTELFGDWAAYNKMAFPAPVRRRTILSDLDHKQKISRSSLINLAQGQSRRKSSSSTTSSGSDVKRDIQPVPKSCKKRNRWKEAIREVRLHLKAARMRLPDELPRSELRIYVSSTPDLQEEREFLEEVAYPRLQELCEELGLNCHVVDMRSGAGILNNDIETFDLIEKELLNSRKLSIGPYFLNLIGHVLDDQNLPGFLHKSVYEEIRETMIRDNIIGVEAFDDVYRLDSNRIPPVYIKQPIRSVEEYKSSEEVERVLYNALSLAVRTIADKRPKDEYTDINFYKWSAVVKETEDGLLTCYTPRSNTLCFMIDSEQVKDVVMENATPIQLLRHKVFQHYKQCASLDNLFSFKSAKKTVAYLRSLSDSIESRVASLLRRQIRGQEYDIAQQLTDGAEAIQHVRVGRSEAQNEYNNADILTSIKNVIDRNDSDPKVVLIWGESGTGKTAIASQAAASSVLWQSNRKVVFRCLGTTLRSSSLFRVLESLVKQLDFLFSLNIDVPGDLSLPEAVSVFCHALSTVSAMRTLYGDLILILDQVDRLPDLDTHYLLCILNSLTDGITLILTLQTPNTLFGILKSHKSVHSVSTKAMVKIEVCNHVTASLKAINRVVTSDQLQSALSALPIDATPLHAQLLFHITQWWPSHTLPELKPFSGRLDTDFCVFIELLERELGRAFIRYALSFLASAKHGLADQEILHLLSKDSDLLNEIKEESRDDVSVVDGFPYQYQISRLITRLGKFVSSLKLEGETVYQITAQPLVNAISLKYGSDGFFFNIHSRLANFFIFIRRGLLLSSKDISEQKHTQLLKYHWRTLRCIPYHLCHSSADTTQVWVRLKEKLFFNFAWLVNEVYAGCFNELLVDISYALDNVGLDPDIQYLRQILRSIRHTVTHNPLSLAAVFASLRPEDASSAKDSLKTVVNEARVWLKQVQLQVLVPASYTSDKTNRLMVKENCMFNVTDLKPMTGNNKLVVQRMRNLYVFHMLTWEEVMLATLSNDIISVHLHGEENLVVLTVNASSQFAVEILNLQNGKHIKTVSLGNSNILWLDIRSLKTCYFGVGSSIKCADLERGSVSTLRTTKNQWACSCISSNKPANILTVTIDDKTKIEGISLQDITESKSVTLKKEPSNCYCKHLLSTKDGRYIIYVTDRQAAVINQLTFTAVNTYTHNGLPIVKAELSRSHEHVFLAYANGAITCHVLHSGNECMTTKTQQRSQMIASADPRDRGRNSISDSSQKDDQTETFTSLVTSEDDHFLFCGTDLGHVYIIHVPTGLQLVVIATDQQSITQIIYLESKSHFQHIITVDASRTARHWNLRPLLKQARMVLQDYITDVDLLAEETAKTDLLTYVSVYENRRQNRMFLNGPDIKAFYQTPPAEVFAILDDLDPAFGVQTDWEASGSIADLCDHLMTLSSANELGGIILTVSKDFRLAKWNLQNGSLMWSKKLPCQGEIIQDMASVYYDQAVLVVQESRAGQGCGISVIYTGEDHTRIMSRDNVISYWISLDRTHVMLACQNDETTSGSRLYLWDLIHKKEEQCESRHPMSGLHSKDRSCSLISFSPRLQSSVSLVIVGDEETKVQSKGSYKQSSFKLRDLEQNYVSVSEIDHPSADSASNFDARNESRISVASTRHSMSGRQISETDLTGLKADMLQNDSDLHMPVKGIMNPRPVSAKDHQNATSLDITESGVAHTGDYLLKIVRTYVYWTEVGVGNFRSNHGQENLKGANNDQSKVRFSDKSKPNSTGTASTTSYSHSRTDNLMQQSTTENLNLAKHIMQEKEIDNTVLENNMTPSKVTHSEMIIPLQVTSLCFMTEQEIIVGTNSKHLLILNLPSFHPIYALGQHGTKLVDDLSEAYLKDVPTTHKDAITRLTMSEDLKVIISSDNGTVCLWDSNSRNLTMKIELTTDQKISHMVVSKDAIIIAMTTNSRTVRLWTPMESREIASYMTMFDITDLHMTCDCRKVIVRGIGPENKQILEIFDILNVDDILMHVADRKESQQLQRREHLANERKTSKQQIEAWNMSPALNVIDESS